MQWLVSQFFGSIARWKRHFWRINDVRHAVTLQNLASFRWVSSRAPLRAPSKLRQRNKRMLFPCYGVQQEPHIE